MADFGRAFANALAVFFTGFGGQLEQRRQQQEAEEQRGEEMLADIQGQIAKVATPFDVAQVRANIGQLEGGPTESFIGAFAGPQLQEGTADLPKLGEAQEANILRGLETRRRLRETATARGITENVREEMDRNIRAQADALTLEGFEMGLPADEAAARTRRLLGPRLDRAAPLTGVRDAETGEVRDILAQNIDALERTRSAKLQAARVDRIAEHVDKLSDDVEGNAAIQDMNKRLINAQQVLTFLQHPESVGSAAVIQAFQRMIDPDSVVRESEIDFILRNFGGLESVRSMINRIGPGGIVNQPSVARQFEQMAREIVAIQAAITLPEVQKFMARAKLVEGTPIDAIFPATLTSPELIRSIIAPLSPEQVPQGLPEAFEQFNLTLMPSGTEDGQPKFSGAQMIPGGGGDE